MYKKYKIDINKDNVDMLARASGDLGLTPEAFINKLIEKYGKYMFCKNETPVVFQFPKDIGEEELKKWAQSRLNFVVKKVHENKTKNSSNISNP